MDTLGPVPIPDPVVIGDFPLRPDYGAGMDVPDRVVAHLMDQPGLKTEQRFFLGDGARRFRIRKYDLTCEEYDELKSHWQDAYGCVAEFDYSHPISHTQRQTFRVRYADPALSFDHLVAWLASDPGLTLVEVPQTTPTLTVGKILERFPDSAFSGALLDQRQRIIPLLKIRERGGSAPLYLSDRRVNVAGGPDGGTRLHLPRLLEWNGISQSLGENSDQAVFAFGNADGAWHKYVNDHADLFRASVEFWLGFENSGTLLKLWRGHVGSQRFLENGSFEISCSDGVYELNLAYPARQVQRNCWKRFKDGVWCPYEGPIEFCPKSWNACVERGMNLYFGGVEAPAQTVRVKDNSTGTWGFGRSQLTSVTVRADTIYQRVLQEVYTDTIRPPGPGGETVSGPSMPVVCDVAGGRDEDTFYAAIGVIGEGPVKAIDSDFAKQTLDGQIPHDPEEGGGFRYGQGFDPALPQDYFGISQEPWDQVPPGSTWAAGTAFAEIRRADPKGLQLYKATEREMKVAVSEGLGGWKWTAPGARLWEWPLTNPVWIAVNMLLKALGLKADPNHPQLITVEMQEEWFDVEEAIFWAGHCDTDVPKLVGEGNERQFPFRGILREQKPLRDWLQEILNTCLGYYSFQYGKLRIGIRTHSGASSAFTVANILHRSMQAEPVLGSFNHLTAEFGDDEFDWQLNRIVVYDIDNARFFGTDSSPRFTQSQMSLVGVSNKSQASRIIATRLREELGGVTREEQRKARNVSFRTTVLALAVYPGEICSLDHPDLPGGRAEFRVQRWRLNPDWTIDISGSSTCDSMYDLVVGPKPEDVVAAPVPAEHYPMAMGTAWLPNEVAPFPDDPVYAPTELTFALRQAYPIEAEGTYSPAVIVRGEMTINTFLEGDSPAIRGLKLFPTGGELPGGRAYYFLVAQRDASADGQFVRPSNFAAVWAPRASNTNRVVLAPVRAHEDMPGYALWVGNEERVMSQQLSVPDTELPSSIEITGPLTVRTRGAPSPQAKRVRIKCREVWHAGVAGIQVMNVTAPNIIQSDELKASDDNWVGQILSIISDVSDQSVPLWNFTITGFNQAAGAFTVSPDCVRYQPPPDDAEVDAANSVEEGDVMIIRSRPTSWTSTKLTNALWKNDVGTAQFPQAAEGLEPKTEIGLTLMIIAGTGRGQIREIVDNDQTSHTVKPPFTVMPDATSIYIVTWSDWPYMADSVDFDTIAENQRIEIVARVTNSVDQTILVGGFLVDDLDQESLEKLACYRDIYVYGEPYQVRTTTEALDQTTLVDQTIRVDTTDGDVELNLLPVEQYFGRKLLVVNDGTGDTPGQAIIRPYAEEEFQTGGAEIVLEKPGEWAEFVAAGDRLETVLVRRRHSRSWHRRKQLARRLLPSEMPGRRRLPMPPPDRKGQL